MRTYSDPHKGYSLPYNPDQIPSGKYDPTLPKASVGYVQAFDTFTGKPVVTGNLMNDSNQRVYQVPPSTYGYVKVDTGIDYAKLVDELLKRIRQDAGYHYELPGQEQIIPRPTYEYKYDYSKQSACDPRDSSYTPWMTN